MKKLIVTAVIFLVLALGSITSASIIEAGAIWRDILLVFGGILFGAFAALLTLVRLSMDNPAIITEIDKADKPQSSNGL